MVVSNAPNDIFTSFRENLRRVDNLAHKIDIWVTSIFACILLSTYVIYAISNTISDKLRYGDIVVGYISVNILFIIALLIILPILYKKLELHI
jgi:hypothetical protein